MRDYVKTQSDNGGVHANSGILHRAFYLTATAIGGFAWEKAGRIWYDAMRDGRLKSEDAKFADFARITHTVAGRLYGEGGDEASAVRTAWETVGVWPSGASRGRKAPTRSREQRVRSLPGASLTQS